MSESTELAVTESEHAKNGYELIESLPNPKQRRFLLTLIQSISIRATVKACKMGQQTHYIWSKDPRYREAFEAASKMRWKALEDSCIERAVADKKDKLLTMFLLKGAYPERYRDNFPINLYSSGPTQININFGANHEPAEPAIETTATDEADYSALSGPSKPDK